MPRSENQPGEQPRPFAPVAPVVLGLVGGVASGKSTVAALFCAHGLLHIDADEQARAAAEDPEVRAEVRSALGERFIVNGEIDRQAVADLVFSDPAAKRLLEGIIHPRVRAKILATLQAAVARDQSCLLDVPLLFEAGLWERCDHIVFVSAPEAVRASRAQARGWAKDELGRRERSQLTISEKRQRSDVVVDNSGTLEATRREVAALLAALEAKQ